MKKNLTEGGQAFLDVEMAKMTLQTTTRTKDGTGKMNIYNELEEIEVLRQRIKQNQDQVLDIYEPQNEKMIKLLVEMNDLLIEVDQVEKEMEQLMQQL
jgi:hypothetical protein